MTSIEMTKNRFDYKTVLAGKEFNKRKKSLIIAYFYCLMMSGFGLHKFYLGEKKQAIKFISLYWSGLIIFAVGFMLMEMDLFTLGATSFTFGLALLTIFGLWWIVDIVTLTFQTRRKNESIKQELLASIR